MDEIKDYYPDLIARLSKVNRKNIIRVNLSDRYRWSDRYAKGKTVKTGKKQKDESSHPEGS